jgi:hypothetical protein
MAGYVYLMKMFVSNDQDIYKFGKTKRKFMERFNEYPKEAQPKIELVLWLENIQTFETDVLREFRSVFQERKDIGYEYFQGDLEKMKQIIVCHFIPAIVNTNITSMLTVLCRQQEAANAKVQVVQDMCDMFNYDVIRDDIITYLNTSSLVSSKLEKLSACVLRKQIDDSINFKNCYDSKLNELRYQIQKVQTQITQVNQNLNEEIAEIKENIEEEITKMDRGLSTMEEYAMNMVADATKRHTDNDMCSNDETITLTHDNILDECVKYTQHHQPSKIKIIDTIQVMLASKKYIMCKTMLTKKLQLKELDKNFKLLAYPETLTQEELQQLLFEA